MADFLLYANYLHQFERSECIVLPRNNPFDDYDEKKLKTRFRLSKVATLDNMNRVFNFFFNCQQVTGTGK